MSIADLIVIAVCLSMDAFAVAVCKGLSMEKINYRHGLLIALFFGGFQALMPLLGWLLGSRFQRYFSSFGAWIAFGLLVFIGGRMALESRKAETGEPCGDSRLDLKELLMLAIATSIDALAVGVRFALLPSVRIVPSVIIIGVTTYILSLLGVVVGNKFGSKYQKKAELIGGLVLILIGFKLLFEQLGVLSF